MPRRCSVFGCKSNYYGNDASTFCFPKDPYMRAKWIKSMNASDFLPTKYSAVCIKHFDSRFVKTEDSMTRADGTVLTVKRSIPALSRDAYPTLFDGQPSYLTKKLSNERATRQQQCLEHLAKYDQKTLKEWQSIEMNKICQNKNFEKVAKFEVLKDAKNNLSSLKHLPSELDVSSSLNIKRNEIEVFIKEEIKIEPEERILNDMGSDMEDVPLENEYYDRGLNPVSDDFIEKKSPENFFIKTESPEEAEDSFEHSFGNTIFQQHGESYLKDYPLNKTICNNLKTYTKEKVFKCDYCNQTFSHRSNLKQHIKTHTGEKPFICDQCNASFSQKITLKNHLRTHTREKPFRCDLCNRCFPHSSTLKSHLRTHTGEKPFSCEHCSRHFSQSSSLRDHLKTHTGEKAFKCEHCNLCFSWKSNLITHLRTHTGEKPFSCDYCDRRFNQKSSLKAHLNIHTGEKAFKCEYCDLSFTWKTNWKTHLRTHTGEKPFSCGHCSRSFAEKATLMKHLRTHTGEKPFSCDQCNRAFSQNAHLKKHLEKHKTLDL